MLELGSEEGDMPANLLLLQSGVGNIVNTVLFGLEEKPFQDLTSYTEVIQDGMIRLLNSGQVTSASATAISLSPETLNGVNADMASYRERIVLRPREISNHPEIVRRRRDRDERHDRGRYVRERQFDARDGIAHSERRWRVGRLRAQRVLVDLHGAIVGEARDDFDHRADGVARGSCGAPCTGAGDGERNGRSAWTLAEGAGQSRD
jgi:hypothetical protein